MMMMSEDESDENGHAQFGERYQKTLGRNIYIRKR